MGSATTARVVGRGRWCGSTSGGSGLGRPEAANDAERSRVRLSVARGWRRATIAIVAT